MCASVYVRWSPDAASAPPIHSETGRLTEPTEETQQNSRGGSAALSDEGGESWGVFGAVLKAEHSCNTHIPLSIYLVFKFQKISVAATLLVPKKNELFLAF